MNDEYPTEAVDRIKKMEMLFELVTDTLKNEPERIDADEEIKKALNALKEYMDSGKWLEDYALDEDGGLPDELKRGVLSQDGLYNLLSELESHV